MIVKDISSTIQRFLVYGLALSIAFLIQESIGCKDSPVGIADSSIIPDERFTATSYYSSSYAPKTARLNGAGLGWAPTGNSDPNDYLQIDLGSVFVICAVATQGCTCSERTTQYKISTSVDNTVWVTYKTGNTDKLFAGNSDSNTVVKHVLDVPVLVRFIRFIPTTYYAHKVLRVEAYGFDKGFPCRSLPVGISDGKIPDSDMTSSSSYNSTTSPSKARLNYTAGSSWCAATSDSSPYLQINLGSPYIICAIATQGDHMTDQWVQSYQMHTSNDGTTFTKYMENSQVKSFTGNFDSSTVVKNLLNDGTISQYIRTVPTSYYGTTNCIRTELYGIKQGGGCTSRPVGISYSTIIPNHRFTASSYYDEARYRPNFARLLTSNKAWGPETSSGGNWLQIDLGSVVYACAVATQGGGALNNEYVTRYKIRVSLDNVNWNYYQENNIDKVFSGNTDRHTVVIRNLTYPVKAKFVRYYPTHFSVYPTMRAEVYGMSSGCSSPLGLEVPGVIQNNQMTSSSHLDNIHTASHGRLYGNSSWCSNTSSNTEYIQINLGQVMTVTGVATQGDHTMDRWIETYTVSYSMDGNLWNTYKAGDTNDKVFQGNRDKKSIVVRWLNHPLTARHVRITPQTWNTSICMRLELYGCDYQTRPTITGLTNIDFTTTANSYVDLVCIVQELLIQYIKWYTNNTDITSQATGLVPVVNGVKSTLRVNSTSSVEIPNIKHFSCFKFPTVSCFKQYVCRAMYGNTKTDADGIKSAAVKIRIVPNKPPTNLRVTALSSTSVRVSWDLPSQNSLFGILAGFKVYYQKGDGSVPAVVKYFPGRDVSYVIDGLAKFTKYLFKVLARTIQDGLYSNAVTVQTKQDAPSAPRGLRTRVIAPTDNKGPQVNLTWDVPAFPNGVVTSYIVSYGHQEALSVNTKIIVGGIRTSMTLHVLGGVVYWFRVRAKTIKEGNNTSVVQITVPIYVPTGSPQFVSSTKTESFIFIVSWQPISRDKANGKLFKYQVTWTLVNKDGLPSKPIISSKMVNANISRTSLDDLVTCSAYNISVRGYTIAGPGPFSVPITLLTSAPEAPKDLSILKAARKKDVTLQWKKPSATKPIKSYTITLFGTKIYNNSFLHKDERESSNTLEKFYVNDLYPDTKYQFQVSASTICGRGQESKALIVSTKIDAPPAPLMKSPPLNITLSSPVITLWRASDINGQIRAYQVVVKEMDSSLPLDVTRLTDYKTAKAKDLHYYIAAQIDSDKFKQEFNLGDGKFYGDFENVKLDENKLYEVAERALTRDKQDFLPGPLIVVAKSQWTLGSKTNKMTASKRGTWILPITLSLLGITVVIILILIIYIRKLKMQARKMNVYERSRSRFNMRNFVFQNAIEMEEPQYPVENGRHDTVSPPITFRDVYEKIDSQRRPERHNAPEQNPSANVPYGTNRQTKSDQKVASSELPANFQPQILIEEYAEVDEPVKQCKKDDIPNENPLDYQGMNVAAKRKQAGRSRGRLDSRIYEEYDPGNQSEYQPLDSSPKPECTNTLQGYGNTGFKSQELDESFV